MVLSAAPRHSPKEGREWLPAHINVPVGKDRALPVSVECHDCSSPEHELGLSQMEMARRWFLGGKK